MMRMAVSTGTAIRSPRALPAFRSAGQLFAVEASESFDRLIDVLRHVVHLVVSGAVYDEVGLVRCLLPQLHAIEVGTGVADPATDDHL